MADAPADSANSTTSGSVRMSDSVRRVVGEHSGQQIPVTRLIDAIIDLHHKDYFLPGSWEPPVWPADLLAQSTEQWMVELVTLLTHPSDARRPVRVFGRIALVGWCLLDEAVAAAAQVSGILTGVARDISWSLSDYLTPHALHILRRRAPLVALSVGELPPIMELPLAPGAPAITRIALAPTTGSKANTPAGMVAAWAAADDRQVFLGHHSPGAPVPLPETDDPVLALGFSTQGTLQVVTRGTRYRVHPPTLDPVAQEEWPLVLAAGVSPQGIVLATEKEVYWAPNPGDAVALDFGRAQDAQVATAGYWVAVLTAGDLRATPVDQVGTAWSILGQGNDPSSLVVATTEHVYTVGHGGQGRCFSWPADPTGTPELWDVVELREKPLFAAAGDTLVVFGSATTVTVVAGRSIVARFQPRLDEGQTITAVGLSPDGSVLAIALFPGGLRFWRIDTVPEVRLTDYAPDTTDGEDLLAIRPTVDALAALLVARIMVPPIAIGLFGEWGSGKTFFMQKLEARIMDLSEDARDSGRSQRSLWAWRNITQVSFNAWHYAAADVWAGLLEHLIRVLVQPRAAGGTELPPGLADLKQKRATTLATASVQVIKAEEAQREAGKALRDAEQAQESKEHALRDAQQKVRELQSLDLADVVKEGALQGLNDALARVELPQARDLGRTIQDIQNARDSSQRLTGLLSRANWPRLIAGLVASLLIGVVVTWLVGQIQVQWSAAAGLVTTALGATGALARWITSAADKVAGRVQEYDKALQAARDVEADLMQKLALAQNEVTTLSRDLAAKQDERRNAEQALADAEAKAAAATPGNLLVEYLEGRHSSGDYRDRLGLIGTVREDLQLISDAIRQHNRQVEAGDQEPDDVVNRIVLYIDDLDRCRPDVVVKVLEAVSMLLSFPMFAVVVAVDAHWISRSLAAVHPQMLTSGDVTPDHYLEKIFQLPVWLKKPDDSTAAVMARALLGPPAASTGSVSAEEGGSPAAPPGPGSGEPPGQPPPTLPVQAAVVPTRVALSTAPPTALVLDPGERASIESLAPMVSRSPRSLKRFINTYRVLKALVPPADLDNARLLLAIATSRPAVGERLLRDLMKTETGTLGDLVKSWPVEFEEHREWLERSIPASYRTWSQEKCAELQPVAMQVRRFVFHVDRPRDQQDPTGN